MSWLLLVTPSCSRPLGYVVWKRDKWKHFGLFITSSTVHIGRQRKLSTYEPKHDKTNKITLCPVKPTQIRLDILPFWPVFAVSVKKPWILRYPLGTQSENCPDCRLIWIFDWRTAILLVLPCGSFHHCNLSYPLSSCSKGHDQNARMLRMTAAYVRHISWFVAHFIKNKGTSLSAMAQKWIRSPY